MASDSGLTPPWSVPLRIVDLRGGLTRRLDADPAARARIAHALDLQRLDSLEAEIAVTPHGGGWEVRGRIRADLAQTCGITLEPLPALVDATFVVRCAETVDPDESPREIVVTLEDDDPPDLIEDGVIDLGAYVVEHLALELDPFPRKPGAAFEPPEAASEPSPFAVLARLKPGTDG